MLDGLAFLPVDDVPAGMTFLRNSIPELDNDNQELADLVQYFDATYVTGSLQRINRAGGGRVILRLRRNPPLFPADQCMERLRSHAIDRCLYQQRTRKLEQRIPTARWAGASIRMEGH